MSPNERDSRATRPRSAKWLEREAWRRPPQTPAFAGIKAELHVKKGQREAPPTIPFTLHSTDSCLQLLNTGQSVSKFRESEAIRTDQPEYLLGAEVAPEFVFQSAGAG